MDFERLQIALEIARPGAGKAHHGVDARRRCGTGADQFAVEEHAWAAVVVADREMRPARDRHRQREYRAIGRARILIEDHAVAPHRQIGSASWRERVWQYV